jgi:mannose-6-phosphate isomerase-like protein (cupin superfamily)
VLEGHATWVAGDEEREVTVGDMVVIPAGTPHRFVNSGETPLRQIDIHASPKFVTEWLGWSPPRDESVSLRRSAASAC